MPRITIERTFATYLFARETSEEESPAESFELTGDELADYEDVARRFAAWHQKLSNLENP